MSRPASYLSRGAALNTLSSALGKVAAFVSVIVATRYMPPEEAGRLFLGLAVAFAFGNTARLGLPELLGRKMPPLDLAGQHRQADALFRKCLSISGLVSLIIAVLVTAAAIAFELDPVIVPAMAAGAFLTLQTVLVGAAQARNRILLAEIPYLGVTIFFFLLLLAAIAIFSPTGTEVMWLRASLELGAACVMLMFVVSYLGPSRTAPPTGSLLSLAVPLWLSGISWLIVQQTDVIVLGALRGPEAVAFYVPILRSLDLALLPLTAVAVYALPHAARLGVDPSRGELEALYSSTTKFAFCFSLPVIALIFIASDQVIGAFFGVQSSMVAPVAQILAGAYWVNSVLGINAALVKATVSARLLLIPSVATFLVAPVAYVVLIGRYGVIGASLGTVVAYLVLNVSNSLLLYFGARISPFHSDVILTVLIGTAGTVIGSALRMWLETPLVVNALLVAIITALSLMTAWRTTNPESRQVLIQGLLRPKADQNGDLPASLKPETSVDEHKGIGTRSEAPPPTIGFVGWVGSNFGDNVMLRFACELTDQVLPFPNRKVVISLDPRTPLDEMRSTVNEWIVPKSRIYLDIYPMLASMDAIILLGGEDLHLSRKIGLGMRFSLALRIPVILLSTGHSDGGIRSPRWLRKSFVNSRDPATYSVFRHEPRSSLFLGDSAARFFGDHPHRAPESPKLAVNLRALSKMPGTNPDYDPASWIDQIERNAAWGFDQIDFLLGDPADEGVGAKLERALDGSGIAIGFKQLETPEDWFVLPRYRAAIATRLHVGMALAFKGTPVLQVDYATKIGAAVQESSSEFRLAESPEDSATLPINGTQEEPPFFIAPHGEWVAFLREGLQPLIENRSRQRDLREHAT